MAVSYRDLEYMWDSWDEGWSSYFYHFEGKIDVPANPYFHCRRCYRKVKERYKYIMYVMSWRPAIFVCEYCASLHDPSLGLFPKLSEEERAWLKLLMLQSG